MVNQRVLFRVCSEREDETRMVATHAKYAKVAKYGGTTMMFVVVRMVLVRIYPIYL